MKYVVAVSGGVDSVVLLDMLVREGTHELTVAHFDHGIREESDWDARFVRRLADNYGLPYVTTREELGPGASEAVARQRRYKFLRIVAEAVGGQIATAHHQDDVIETIAINQSRGTGWRGLAVLADPTLHRPLLNRPKAGLYDYALARGLEWIEDETNLTNDYLRNRLRRSLGRLEGSRRDALIELWQKQKRLAAAIDRESAQVATTSRYFLTMIDEASALEVLRQILYKNDLSLTRPQRRRLLYAIKTARPGTTFEAGQGVDVVFGLHEFVVKHP